MWFAKIHSDFVEIFENDFSFIIYIKGCEGIYKAVEYIYLIDNSHLYCYMRNRFIYKKELLSRDLTKILFDDTFYVSDEDNGTIYQYDLYGNIIRSKKLGEHISDFEITDSFIYGAIYHENKIIKCTMDDIIAELKLNNVPKNVIFVKNKFYILTNDHFFSYIYMIDCDLNIIKIIKFDRQIGCIKNFNNKIVFCGTDIIYILNEELHIISQRKSTGKFLCKFGNVPIFECGKKRLDIINNIIYPL